MIGKRAIAVVAGSLMMLAVTSGRSLAHGVGHGGGDHEMWLLARAAGLSSSQIASAFHDDANLKTDRAQLKSEHDAMMACLVAGNCTNQVSSFASALQTMAHERMTVWQNLFKTAPNLSQAAGVYSQLQQLRSTKKQILQSVFGQGDTSPNG